MELKICYIVNNGTRRASDRKVKQAGLLFGGIEKIFPNCYNIINIPATPLSLWANAQPGRYFFCGGLLGVINVT
jgi:hypothetical protein